MQRLRPGVPAAHGPSRPGIPVAILKPPVDRSVVMRIAQVAPLYEAVPPGLYGGTERVIAALCDSLVRAGSRGELVRRHRLDHGG